MPGSSLRRARSPVAPTSTTTCGNCGPTPGGIFATIHILFVGLLQRSANRGTKNKGRARSTLLILGEPRVPGEKRVDFPHRHRGAVKVALRLIAFHQSQDLELLGGFDAFSHSQQTEG